MLLHIPDVLGRAQVTLMRDALDAADWTDGRETVGAQGARVKRNQQLPDGSPLRQQLGEVVMSALAQHPLYHAATLPLRTLPPRFNRYEGGGQYGFHVDGAVMALPAEAGQLRSDISCTLFLSEPDNYDGGELIVSDTYGEHEVKLPAGDLIVYPSSSLHRVQPVTSRRTTGLVLLGAEPDPRRRSAATAVRTGHLDPAPAAGPAPMPTPLLQLTGVYHNLLRQWAET